MNDERAVREDGPFCLGWPLLFAFAILAHHAATPRKDWFPIMIHKPGKAPAAKTALLLCSLVLLGSCAGKQAVSDSPNPPLVTASLSVGKAQVIAELARTDTERERGLMFRKSLPEGRGMLFIFDKDDRLSFWMKNTMIPLSLAYIASDGTIRQIVELVPESLAPVQAERSVRYALEMPKGWFERAGVHVGDSVDLSGVKN
jgi:uncharacterized membrane protein (UPF0127 family)